AVLRKIVIVRIRDGFSPYLFGSSFHLLICCIGTEVDACQAPLVFFFGKLLIEKNVLFVEHAGGSKTILDILPVFNKKRIQGIMNVAERSVHPVVFITI